MRRVLVAAMLAAAALATAACGGDGRSTAAGSPTTPVATASPSDADRSTPSASRTRALDPVATAVTPVTRPGVRAATATVARQPLKGTARYTDGLSIAITKVTNGKITGQGPGIFTGDPLTTLSVTLKNGTPKDISLDAVVATLTYGTPLRRAQPVYGPTSSDFNGTVKQGATASATYAFSVPTAQLSSVTLTLDVDGLHGLATFSGSATS